MNVLTVPRTIGAYEYKALRYPAQLLETKVVAVRLSEGSTLRLAYERLLGTLDATAGSLFADQGLKDRGRLLTRRADVVEKAVQLEEKAEQRKAAADADLRRRTEKAAADKREAQAEHERAAAKVAASKQAAQAAVEREAQARKRAEDNAITAKAEAALAAERDRHDRQQATIEARTAARTAAPKAQLAGAVKDSKAAAKQKADADELAKLAKAQRESRRS